MSATRPVPATTSSWEFEQKRDVARSLDSARRSTADFQGSPVEELGENFWVNRIDNTGLEFRVIRDSALDDELDGPDGYWDWE